MLVTPPLSMVYKEIDFNLREEHFESYLRFLERGLIDPKRRGLEYLLRIRYLEKPVLVLRLKDREGLPLAELSIQADKNPKVWAIPLSRKCTHEMLENLVRRVELATIYFLETHEPAHACFILLPRMRLKPERIKEARRKLVERLFFGTMFPLFALSLIFAYLLFVLLGAYILIAMPLSQLLILLFSDKIVEGMADWKLGPGNRRVYLVCYTMPRSEYSEFMKKFFPLRYEIKKRLYEETLAKRRDITPEIARRVFSEFGMILDENHEVYVKKVDVYNIVSRIFSKFNLPIPRIAILNTVIPNAAATGIGHYVALVVLTSGLLMKLSEEEIEAVLAHEASHVKNHDPLMLFILSTGEYLLRLFIFFSFIYFMINPLIDLIYLFIAFTILFFIAKFFEARADLESALVMGKPEVLARALKKIALRKLLVEKYPKPSFESWLGWDPHPPVSWRIIRLEKRKYSTREHPLLASIRDCILGFISTL